MKTFIPCVRFRNALWSDDKNVWEAVHPGWWSLMERTFTGEQVFDDPPTADPHMIVNLPSRGDDEEPEPGLSGTMDIMPGRARVILLSSWGALVDIVPPKSRRIAHDWFNAHHGFTGGIRRDRDRDAYVVGFRLLEFVDDAPTFQALMTRILGMEEKLRAGDAAARVHLTSKVQVLPLPPYSR